MSRSGRGFFFIVLFLAYAAIELCSRYLIYIPNVDVFTAVSIVFAVLRFGVWGGVATAIGGVLFLSFAHVWQPIQLTTAEKFVFWSLVLGLTGVVVEFYRRQIVRREETLAREKTKEIEALLEQTSRQAVLDAKVSENKFRVTFDAAGIGIAHVLPSGRFDVVNKKLCDILGYSEEELVSKTFQEITVAEDLSKDLELLTKMLAGEIQSYMMRKSYFHKSGSIVIVNLTVTLIRQANGEPDYFVSMIEDITERQRIESEKAELMIRERTALKSSEAKSRFLANMSHEIRTPINGIIGMTNLTLDTELTSEQSSYIGALKSSGELLLRIVNDILDFSKVEAGKLELENTSFNMVQLIDEVSMVLSPTIKSKKLGFFIDMSREENWQMIGDHGRLRQVLLNLIGNAVKFTPQGEIKIHVARDVRARVTFEITDTGIGIQASKIDSLFTPFMQADSSTSRKYGGTGLGLSISKQIIDLMGGQISVKSRPGSGSCFTVEIPFVESVEQAPMPQLVPKLDAVAKKKILVVEDNAVNLTVAIKYLEKLGHTAIGAANGREALHLLNEIAFDLIFMDCQMPELDGYETTGMIRANPILRKLPVIALTANVLEGEKKKCLAAGMDDFLTKPIAIQDLSAMVVRWGSKDPSVHGKSVRA